MAERKGGAERNKDKSKYNPRAGKPLGQQDICVGEELKIAVNVAVDRFRSNDEEKELEFPSSLTANERAYIHRFCQDLGLNTKSKGKGNKRFLTIYKDKIENEIVSSQFSLTTASSNQVSSLLSSFPVTNRDRHELSGQKLHKNIVTEQGKILSRENRLVLGNSPHVPPEAKNNDLNRNSQKLPIFAHKEEILKSIAESQVVFIAGDTGSGKTTQVGKYILERCTEKKQACRIICTQPRRLSAMSISERVAAERGERIGGTIGYQVRLDSKLSPKTLLQFCTNGVLLRLLMVGHKCLSNITHIIVDEIHERDLFSDYLLISLRDLQKTYKKLKVVLMSAALNIDLFTNYFGACPFINIPGSCYEVKTYFLEDVLKHSGYISKRMRKALQDNDFSLFQQQGALDAEKVLGESAKSLNTKTEQSQSTTLIDAKIKEEVPETAKTHEDGSDVEIEIEESEIEVTQKSERAKDDEERTDNLKDDFDDLVIDDSEDDQTVPSDHDEVPNENNQMEDTIIEVSDEMNSALAQAWLNGDDEAFDQIINLIMNENIHIDYQHTETKMTSLIVAAARGNQALTEQLVELGANLDIRDPKNNRDAEGWAKHFNQNHVAEFLQRIRSGQNDDGDQSKDNEDEEGLTEQDRRRLELYHKSFDDQKVDSSLIMSLLNHICRKANSLQGAVLIFLPGYDDIMTLRDRLIDDREFSKRSKYQILMLHSMLPPGNQRKVFGKPPKGVRKIILSTNIAETSITIEDVVYVIDSGKVKEKSHDAIGSVSMLRTTWISKASAIQRRGRAGRCLPGICYHLFSQERFHHFQMFQDAEILRVPIHDLCLQTKMLAPVNVPITDYLLKAPEPPSNMRIRSAIKLLKTISALDENEDMTDLGKLLVELPIDPQLGKMIFMGMTLKCLEPAIVIACCCSYKEPFSLPSTASLKSSASSNKYKLSSGSYSDQIAMLRAFQGWQRARRDGRDKLYCFKNYVSPGTMEMVSGMRRQILTQLRNLGFVRTHGSGDIKDLNANSRNWSVIKAVIAAGLYPNFVKVNRNTLLLVSEKEKKVNIHNSSVIMAKNEDKVQSTVSRAKKMKSIVSSLPFDWLIYEELSRLYYSVQIRSVSVLSSAAVALFGGPSLSYEHSSLRLKSSTGKRKAFFQESDSEQEENVTESSATFKIDDWITFCGDDNTLNAIAMLRMKFLSLFSKRIQLPAKPWSEADDAIVQCVTNVLTKEDQVVGLTNPATKDIEKNFSLASTRRPEKYATRGGRYESSDRGGYRGGYASDARGRGRGGKYPSSRPDRRRKISQSRSSENEEEEASEPKETKRRQKRFFIIKCNNEKNMAISFERSIWATTKNNENKLNKAFHNSEQVFLVFSVQGSGHFQGVARMKSGISNRVCDDFGSTNLGGVFDIEWVHKEEIAFQYTQHLINPWNDYKKVQISRDAQELEPSVGEALIYLWETQTLESPLSPRARRSESPIHSSAEEDVDDDNVEEEDEEDENRFYSGGADVYGEGSEGAYVEGGYQLYSPPPFSPQFVSEFSPHHVSTHFAPPPPHMAYQQPYPVYAPPGGMPPTYRHQGYYQFQYPPQRRGNPQDVYNGRNTGQYPRHEGRNNSRGNNNYRS